MSQANIELCRRCIDAVTRADTAAAYGLVSPDVEMQDYPGLPDAQWHRGYEGVIAWTVKLAEVVGEFRLEGSNYVAREDCVVFDWQATGHGRRAGVPIELEGAGIVRCQGGRVVRLEVFMTRGEALEVAGVAE